MHFFKISDSLTKLINKIDLNISEKFEEIENIGQYNEEKILKSFIDNKISSSHFVETTGYGYCDFGREAIDKLYAQIFNAEDALVRTNFVSGTHAISVALFSILKPSDEIIFATGKPYATIQNLIEKNTKNNGFPSTLKDYDVCCKQLKLLDNGTIDYKNLIESINEKTKAIYIQRSRGYSTRPSISISETKKIIEISRNKKPNLIIIIDNCYCELVEKKEPTEVGADIVCGSLIKNPGGGIAKTGGYIVGKKKLIELCAERLTAPGLGKEMGCSLNQNRNILMGIFLAPNTVKNAVKTSIFARNILEEIGFKVFPKPEEKTTDIVSVIQLGSKQSLETFCEGIQKGSPIDSFVTPQACTMPGYGCKIIMAAGTFTQGASIEITADAPLLEPYNAYLQGGLTYNNSKNCIITALQKMIDKKLIKLQ